MALARIKTWNPGDTLTAADLNTEFNNPLNNALSLISPLSGTLAFSGTSPFSVANAQTLTISIAAQTVGAATLTIPNFASVADTLAFTTLAQTLSNKTLSAPVLSGTTTGTYTLGGTPTISSTVAFTNASPFSVANAQTLTLSIAAQTVGAATLTVPNFAGVADTLAFTTLAQTLSNKTLSAPTFSGAYTLGGTPTFGATMAGASTFSGNITISGNTLVDAFGGTVANGIRFFNNAMNAERMRLTDGGILALGTTFLTGAAAGEFLMINNTAIKFLNAAGTALLVAIYANTSNQLTSPLIRDNTTASASNVFIDSTTGAVLRSTSSRLYKTDIAYLDPGSWRSVVLGLRPASFRGLNDERHSLGFIAEDVAPLDSRLVTVGPDEAPDYVQYDRIPAYLTLAVQELHQRLLQLEASSGAKNG